MSGSIRVYSDGTVASAAPFGSVIRMILPPRAATSCMFETVFSNTWRALVERRDHDHRHGLVDQRDRPVLELARRIAFGVDVGDFLELQRAFERDRIGRAAAEIEHVAWILARSRASASICGSSRSASDMMARHLDQRADQIALVLLGQHAARAAGGDGEAERAPQAGR